MPGRPVWVFSFPYYIEIQHLSAMAWLAYQEDRQKGALEMMLRAAEMETATEKHPVTPGETLPARELLADMLLVMDRHEEAQTAYEATLERSANRFNSLYGAGRAAELGGTTNGRPSTTRNLSK